MSWNEQTNKHKCLTLNAKSIAERVNVIQYFAIALRDTQDEDNFQETKEFILMSLFKSIRTHGRHKN